MQPGSTIIAEKREKGTFQASTVNLRTNVYGLSMKHMLIYRYDITLLANTSRGRDVFLTKKARGE